MGWRIEIAGHLNGQHSTRKQRIHQTGKQAFVVAHPMQGCIGKQQIKGSSGSQCSTPA
jgi:hypothetical protein